MSFTSSEKKDRSEWTDEDFSKDDTEKMGHELENLGLFDDFEKLFYNGFCYRQQLVTLKKEEIDRLRLVGTLEQYKSIYSPALKECWYESPECEAAGQFTPEELFSLLEKAKIWRDWIDEKLAEKERQESVMCDKKRKLEEDVLRVSV
jgi:hypothetical protein